MIRVTTVVVFLLGSLIYAPAVYMDDKAPLWLVPAAVVGSAIPFLAVAATGPFVTSVRAHLPSSARRSKDDLIRFANNTPPTTLLRIQFIRWAPWLVTREIFLGDLRRLRQSKVRLANLEHVLPEGEKKVLHSYGKLGRGIEKYFSRYWVNVTSTSRDRSSVPGVWDNIWKQIPYIDEPVKAVVGKAGERRPVVMQNRTSAVQQVPPPPARARGIRR